MLYGSACVERIFPVWGEGEFAETGRVHGMNANALFLLNALVLGALFILLVGGLLARRRAAVESRAQLAADLAAISLEADRSLARIRGGARSACLLASSAMDSLQLGVLALEAQERDCLAVIPGAPEVESNPQ